MIKSGLVGDDYEVTPLRSKSRTVNVLRKRVTQNQFDLRKKQRFHEEYVEKSREKAYEKPKLQNSGKYQFENEEEERIALSCSPFLHSTHYGQNRNYTLTNCYFGSTVLRLVLLNSSGNLQFSKTSLSFLAQFLKSESGLPG